MNANEELLKAARAGDIAKAEQALKNGADVHANNNYALQIAYENDHREMIKLLAIYADKRQKLQNKRNFMEEK